MKKQYKKITEQDVLHVLINANLTINDIDGTINLINIAYLLETSRYQVKKHIDSLVEKGYAERKMICFEEGPPYHGYRLTEKVLYGDGEAHELYRQAFTRMNSALDDINC